MEFAVEVFEVAVDDDKEPPTPGLDSDPLDLTSLDIMDFKSSKGFFFIMN